MKIISSLSIHSTKNKKEKRKNIEKREIKNKLLVQQNKSFQMDTCWSTKQTQKYKNKIKNKGIVSRIKSSNSCSFNFKK